MNKEYEVFQVEEVKEAVSHYCAFSLGKKHVLELEPSFSRLYIERELKRVKEMSAYVVRYGSLPLGGIRDISIQLNAALISQTLNPLELLDIANHAYACEQIRNSVNKDDLSLEEIRDLVGTLRYSTQLSAEINRCINDNGEVVDSASTKLKSLRKSLKQCEANLHKTALDYVRNNLNKLTEQITTTRNDRIVVLAKNSEKSSINGFIHGESNSGQTVYMEPECLLTLNNERQTILSQIEEEIYRILTELTRRVKSQANDYLNNLVTLELLDSYNARALWSKDYDGCVASLSDRLVIRGGRHPLLDQKSVVSNTYHIDKEKRMLLISGPNTGGKTVSLKIIGLFTLLTLCGMPISADEAEIPLFDAIYVDIGDQQSILENLSTFSAHMNSLAAICDNVTENSLVILDEPGNGTDPAEGECLAMAVLDYLREKKCFCAVTTHFTKLKTYGKRYPEIMVASVEFNEEELKPTYRYVEGVSGQSNAIEIARRLGLKESILERAKQLRVSSRTREESLLEQLERSLAEAKRYENELQQQRSMLEGVQKQLDKEVKQLQDKKDEYLEEAKMEAQIYVEEARKETDALLKLLRETDSMHEAIAIKHELDTREYNEPALEEEEEVEEDHELQVNDYVGIRNTNQRGVIEAIQKNKAIVNVNGLKMTSKLSDLKYLGKKPEEKKVKTRVKVSRPSSMSIECNLIGMRVDEALPVLDKFIDDAILMNAPFLRIIHGYGTGALRKAVWNHLKNNRYIEEMRYGGESEGGSGATIITFKRKK